ncbi:MAG: alpha/beta hydrolase-fold protein [Gemmatimonadota bacterium]|nr:alpha/beta hydrolase-fold protein [Gemmatimonadota bacterium]
MSRLKIAALVVGVGLIAATAAGGIGAAVATALVTQLYSRQVQSEDFERIAVESELLGETRDLRVRVPVGYDADPEARYPVLLVLDGGSHDGHTAHVAEVLFRLGLGKQVIVVGVTNGVAGRSVDFTPPGDAYGPTVGRADRFLQFLDTEAMPAIDRRFRTNSSWMLAGNSLGALFVTYSLLQRPELFDARFAFSPSWWVGDQALVPELERFLVEHPDVESYFYTSLGSRESRQMGEAFDAGTSVLTQRAPVGLRWHADRTAGADHGTNAVLSTPVALRGYWEGVRGE